MTEHTRQVRPRDPFDQFSEALKDARLYENYERADLRTSIAPYERNEHTQLATVDNEPVPLFLADNDDHRFDKSANYTFGKERPLPVRTFRISHIVSGAVALAIAAGAAALFSMDSTNTVAANSKVSLAGVGPVSIAVTPPETPQQPRVAVVSPVTPELPGAAPAPGAQAAKRSQPGTTASATPSRDEITAAYQSAVKSRVVAMEPAARETPVAIPSVRSPRGMNADDLALLLKRANGFLTLGDIASARLLLERAADAQEAEAALMLARTYDPQVLGKQDQRSITPDPAMARGWYQKAAQLGSADAKHRLSQLQ